MYKEALRQAWVEIDLSAVEHNIEEIRGKIGNSCNIIGVVKADAYGHGSVECAKCMKKCGVKAFAVATIEEALELREEGIDDEILLLGIAPDMCADIIIDYDLTPVVATYKSAKAISDMALEKETVRNIFLVTDTGMGRIGYRIENEREKELAKQEILMIDELEGVRIVGMMSHFSTADEKSKEYTYHQLDLFNDFYEELSIGGINFNWITISNSAAVIDYPNAHFDAVRPGIILYGCYPSNEVNKENFDLKPVMSVKANITYIKTVPKGTSISYGRKFIAERESRIATIAIGYADGYSRLLSGKAEVLLKGKRVPVIGNICMDQCMIDVTDIDDAEKCDEVIIMGESEYDAITAEELAEKEGTVNYEILCSFGMRLPKIYKIPDSEKKERK